MHMADALISPTVGGAMWLAGAAALGGAARSLRARADDRLAPLMGVLGAFVFAVQMVNFAIPGTGSSGHLGGGLLLAILLGPSAALVVMASVLAVQALFFADGGLLAYGANLVNLGVVPCLLAYPLVYRPLAGRAPTPHREARAVLVAAVMALLAGAAGVVLQTTASGVVAIGAPLFAALMLPLHLVIGIAEGVATAALVLFLRRTAPEVLPRPAAPSAPGRRPLLIATTAALVTGGVLSWFASTQPDGLEWAASRAATGESPPPSAIQEMTAQWQHRIALLPDYGWRDAPAAVAAAVDAAADRWPSVRPATSVAGVGGAIATLLLVRAAALLWRRRRGPLAGRAPQPARSPSA